MHMQRSLDLWISSHERSRDLAVDDFRETSQFEVGGFHRHVLLQRTRKLEREDFRERERDSVETQWREEENKSMMRIIAYN